MQAFTGKSNILRSQVNAGEIKPTDVSIASIVIEHFRRVRLSFADMTFLVRHYTLFFTLSASKAKSTMHLAPHSLLALSSEQSTTFTAFAAHSVFELIKFLI